MVQPNDGRDPEDVYGGPDGDGPPQPATTGVANPPPAGDRPFVIDQELVNYMDRRYSAALADFSTKLQKDLLELMDQKLVAAINTQAALNSPPPGEPPTAVNQEGQPVPGMNFDALATAAMPIINMIAAKFLGAPAAGAEAPAGLLQQRFKEVADVVTMVNSTFMANHDDSMRTGMRIASDAYTYAYKATGVVPDAAVFNASITPPAPGPEATPGGLTRRTVDVQAEAARIAAKITGG